MEKQLLALLTVTLLTSAAYFMNGQDNSLTLEGQYGAWKAKFGKKFSQFEDVHRFSIFASNLAQVLEHNGRFQIGEETFELAMNEFAAMTNEEFTATYLTLKANTSNRKNVKSFSGKAYPASVDWSKGLTVKNQGSCGSCWAFSAVAALEGYLVHKKNDSTQLSEQEFVDCVTAQLGYESEGCNGGWMDDALDYTSKYGVATGASYPYTGKDEACKKDTKARYVTSKGLVDVASQNFDAFHEALAQQPLSVAINAGGIFFQLYSKGIYTRSCAGTEDDLNHGVLAAGYASDYYNVKNSWGASWGEAGYIRLGIVSKPEGQCGIQQLPSYPVF